MDKVTIFDTTLRDGEQSPGVALTTADKLEIAHQLARLGVDVIEAGFPRTSPGDFEGITQQMQSNKITVSTVACGTDCDNELLETIARIGNGRYYLAEDPAQVPQIFAKETVTASKSAIDEQPFIPQTMRATRALADIDMDNAPFLLGYVMTRAKPTSEVILITEKGDPLLAWWRYGLGMSVAFTSDAKARWAAEWITWPGFGKFWAQVVRHAMRKAQSKGIVVAVERKGEQVSLTLDAATPEGAFLNDADSTLTLIDPRLGDRLDDVRPVLVLELAQLGAQRLGATQRDRGALHARSSWCRSCSRLTSMSSMWSSASQLASAAASVV